jgi:hypothetical protein
MKYKLKSVVPFLLAMVVGCLIGTAIRKAKLVQRGEIFGYKKDFVKISPDTEGPWVLMDAETKDPLQVLEAPIWVRRDLIEMVVEPGKPEDSVFCLVGTAHPMILVKTTDEGE